MNELEKPELGASMSEWAQKLKFIRPDLAIGLDEPRISGHAGVERLGLPRYERVRPSIHDFLSEPEQYFDRLKSDKYYVHLEPAINGVKPERSRGITKDEVINFVRSRSSQTPDGFQNIILAEYYDNIYGGNAIVNKSGEITMEMVRGEQSEISSGHAIPDFVLTKDPITGRINYSGKEPAVDEGIRKIMYNTLQEIPHDEHEYLPGYYEFHIVKKDNQDILNPIFVDYRNNLAYEK